jgi:hypothetical protein
MNLAPEEMSSNHGFIGLFPRTDSVPGMVLSNPTVIDIAVAGI